MYNDPVVLTHRKLQMLGYFPKICRELCSKVDNPREENLAALTHKMKYPDTRVSYALREFADLMRERERKFIIRALSPALISVLEAYPQLHDKIDFIIDRDPNAAGGRHRVLTPEKFCEAAAESKHILLVGSEREAVFNSVLECADRFDEVYRLNFSRLAFEDYRVTRLLP